MAIILNKGVRFTWAAPISCETVNNYEIRHDTDSDLEDGATKVTVAGDADPQAQVQARSRNTRCIMTDAERRPAEQA